MNIVYSYNNTNTPNFIPIETLYPGILSAIYANQLYGNSKIIASKDLIERFKKVDLPFSEFEISPFPDRNSFLHKISIYTIQKAPFIHLDLDLILFSKIEPRDSNSNYFAHKDIPYSLNFNNDGFIECYMLPSYYLTKKYGKELLQKVTLDNIPNMCITYSNNLDTLQSSVKKVLELYNDNTPYFKNNYYRLIYLEQAMIHKYLIDIDSIYSSNIHLENKHHIFDRSLTLEIKGNIEENTLREWYVDKEYQFSDTCSMLELYSITKLPAVHFIGGNKYTDLVQLLVLHKLNSFIGIKKLELIDKEFNTNSYSYLEAYKKLIK